MLERFFKQRLANSKTTIIIILKQLQMTKLNLDNIVQQKLGELDIKYKAEHWDEMEDKLNSSSASISTNLGASSSISSTYLIAIVTIGITALSVITYMLLNNNSNDSATNLIENKVLVEKINPVKNTKELDTKTISKTDKYIKAVEKNTSAKSNNSVKTIVNKESSKKLVVNSTKKTSLKQENTSNDINNDKAVPKIDTDNNIVEIVKTEEIVKTNNTKLVNTDTETNQEYIGEPITIGSDSCSGSSYIKRTSHYHKGSKENNGKEKIKKNNELKNVTPITKPVKRVFRKRKGGFWGLISKR